MKIRITISDPAWRFKVRVRMQQPGSYYVSLVNNDGSAVPDAPILGYYSFEEIQREAAHLYNVLLIRLAENLATAPSPQPQPIIP